MALFRSKYIFIGGVARNRIAAIWLIGAGLVQLPRMEGDKRAKAGKATLDTILSTMERGFAAVASDIGDVKDEVANIKSTMATKDNVRAIVAEELAPIHGELKSIRRDLDDLREKVENVIGFRKEIDHALERIAAIEKHLGIDKKIAA